ncbi:helix-turn-helix domain-containing protein [Methylovirgula sp. 4M-Z18]|uniref:helix-turn-helix domain-containing protein n=1 Tax=Methylovirgula sp. 4M-Z18 TaxID=2293567 RepID=UPI000E2EFD6E|nr:helix-turn-helix domain-containing protein [Methylovirgula sp. 4M-Z18]RFB79430.1 helix-turn-helix domain-containing protein [Methylovirgula sp. 4M-Z18]
MGDESSAIGNGDTDDATAARARQERRRWPRVQDTEDAAKLRAPPALKPLSFTTQDLPSESQFGGWKNYVSSLMDVQLPDDVSEDGGFVARHTAWNFRHMLLVQQRASAYRYQRTEARLRASPLDHWAITLRRSGRSWTEVGGKVAECKPGTIEIRSLGRPYRGRMLDSEFLTIYMPRSLFGDSVWLLDINNNRVLSSNLANVLAVYIGAIEARLNDFTEEELPRVIGATRDMIIACLSSPEGKGTDGIRAGSLAVMERARKFVSEKLLSTQITPEMLCKELGLSRTHLYKLFAPSGGVVRYIQKQRLLATHAALSDPRDRRHVSTIADAFGFNSSADFSRAFSREFGYSPTQARQLMTSALLPEKPKIAEAPSFDAWLKELGR